MDIARSSAASVIGRLDRADGAVMKPSYLGSEGRDVEGRAAAELDVLLFRTSTTVHADQSIPKVLSTHCGVDSGCLRRGIRILGAHDDTRVLARRRQTNEVPSIERQENTIVVRGERQDSIVRDSTTRVTGVQGREHVVTERTQLPHDCERDVLVRVEPQADSFSAISRSISA